MSSENIYPLRAVSMDGFDWALKNSPGRVAYDIGANDGGMSHLMAQGFKKVFAFEPTPFMFKKLCGITECGDGRVVPVNMGVGAAVGVINGVKVHHAWTIIPNGPENDTANYDGNSSFDMRMTTIDDWASTHESPDFIKLDVDGYESDVLLGGVLTLQESKPPIMFEYSYMAERFLGRSPAAMADMIYRLGYRAWSMDLSYCCEDGGKMLSHYPAHTSFDIMLIHRDTR